MPYYCFVPSWDALNSPPSILDTEIVALNVVELFSSLVLLVNFVSNPSHLAGLDNVPPYTDAASETSIL
ncbi:hypothetical protein INT44_005803 [Umbelopsis vinacea]|uniref:Uncharacterized protein n=1 Tax=Umbelopsis vinacea TaxID=44442 RepID=A0A8H7PYY3_9FUNG|nr:hypothetical protein INT44_005803 [Umbelopsis vinacea]